METIQLHDKQFSVYIHHTEIRETITQLAQQINSDYHTKTPLFIGILNGSFIFASELIQQFNGSCEVSFVKVKSYSGTNSTGKVNELIGLDTSIENRDIIIVEDIVDTGLTLEFIYEYLQQQKPKSIKIATFLLKPEVFNKKTAIDYVGKEIPNKFIVGYGLDYNGLGRNLKNIYSII